MSDTSTIELSPAPTASDEPYISLVVLDDMRLLMSPTQIAREGEHNSALFKVTAQPSSLDPYSCRAEVQTSDGNTTYRVVDGNGEFRLTIDMSVPGLGRLQLVYSDGVDVTRKTATAQFTVAGSLNAVDQNDPDFQDGLAQLQSRAFANVTYAADSGLLAFYNVGMNPLDSVIVAGGAGGVPDVPATNGAYARFRSSTGADWVDFTTLGVAPINSPQFTGNPTAPTPPAGVASEQIATAQFVLSSPAFIGNPSAPTPPIDDASARLATTNFVNRDALMKAGGQMAGPIITVAGTGPTNPGIGIGDNSTGFFRSGPGLLNVSAGGVGIVQFMAQTAAFFVPINAGNNPINSVGDPAQPLDGLNLRTGDSRYLQQTVADNRYLALVGGALSGDLRMQSASGPDAEISLYLGGRGASIYWGNATVLRRGGAGESVYIENNNGSVRSEVLTQVLGDGRYLQQPAADARYLQLAAGGIVAGPMQVLTPPVIANDAANKGYVDAAVGGVTASTALRSQVYAPAAFAIPVPSTVPQQFFDGNFTLPAVGIRQILITVDPLFSSAGAQGSMWSLIYTLAANSVVSAAVVPMIAYKFTTDDDGMLRATAKFLAAIDATSGAVRVQLYAHCPTSQGGGGALTQVGNVQPTGPQTLITIQDLGPVS